MLYLAQQYFPCVLLFRMRLLLYSIHTKIFFYQNRFLSVGSYTGCAACFWFTKMHQILRICSGIRQETEPSVRNNTKMSACFWITKKMFKVFILLGIRLKHGHNLCYRFTKKNQLIRVIIYTVTLYVIQILINVILSGIRLHWLHYMFFSHQEENF